MNFETMGFMSAEDLYFWLDLDQSPYSVSELKGKVYGESGEGERVGGE